MKIVILVLAVALFWYFVFSFRKFRKTEHAKRAHSGEISDASTSHHTDNSSDCGGGDGSNSD